MSKQAPSSAALPLAHAGLRILIIVNWAMALVILALLFALPHREWIMSAFDLSPSLDAEHVIRGMRVIAGVGLVTIPINYFVLRHLLAMVETVRAGDPFVASNARRLQEIAWSLLVLQLLSIVIGATAKSISTAAHPVHLDAGFSVNGWLAVLLTFILARVFAAGARMRDDLEGTV